MPKVFLDTGILVHASDQDSPEKLQAARVLLRRVAAEGGGVVALFFVVGTVRLFGQ